MPHFVIDERLLTQYLLLLMLIPVSAMAWIHRLSLLLVVSGWYNSYNYNSLVYSWLTDRKSKIYISQI